ncbi:putative C6 transcription [Rosellinia necatrix]|uniref:Putative C6 transcription n=1 Tax=Rosellinia necatrix TaxID=77044 RepID=A0A1W2TJU6_ROSNE|nr:putative C6 transcription [Rosellinia necatrix]
MATTTRSANGRATAAAAAATFSHAPSGLTLFWLAVSVPLVIWDCGYVLLRPRTMPGGDLHWPLWAPYELYGQIDYVYGWKAFHAKSGFTGAQGLLNVVETLMYIYYALAYYRHAVAVGGSGGRKALVGRKAAVAVLVAFSASVMTLSKTVLYWLCEYYSGYDNIGHNSLQDLIFLWIIPNGAWLVGPTFMIFELGNEMVNTLAGGAGVKRD